ncbi:MAG: bifunctional ADP-dependent NAD(P)H-hydrate dehydratase/NAD(P)H-hydrate epimerase, partial [Clostridia bacterium]
PSGCDADSGIGLPVSVMADVTVTFGAPKPGILLEPGNLAAGRVVLRDIGIPGMFCVMPGALGYRG